MESKQRKSAEPFYNHDVTCNIEGKEYNDKKMVKPCGKKYHSGDIVRCNISKYLKCLHSEY